MWSRNCAIEVCTIDKQKKSHEDSFETNVEETHLRSNADILAIKKTFFFPMLSELRTEFIVPFLFIYNLYQYLIKTERVVLVTDRHWHFQHSCEYNSNLNYQTAQFLNLSVQILWRSDENWRVILVTMSYITKFVSLCPRSLHFCRAV